MTARSAEALSESVPRRRYRAHGIVPAVVTPFTPDGAIDFDAFRRLLSRLVAEKVHGLCVLGSQGEFFSVSPAEHLELVTAAVATADGLPVMAGVTAIATRDSVALAEASAGAGADALLLMPPPFVGPSPAEIEAHVAAVAAATDLPVILYNQPARLGVTLTTDLVQRLAAIPNVEGVKDSGGSLAQTLEYRAACPPQFTVLIGHDALIGPAMLAGIDGSIASSANLAGALLVALAEAATAGDLEQTNALQARASVLRAAFALAGFPVAVLKAGLALQGLPVGDPRPPIAPLPPDAVEALRDVLRTCDLLGEDTAA